MDIQTLPIVPRSWIDPILRASAAKSLLAQPHHVLFSVGEKGQGGHLLARLVPQTPADILTLYIPEPYRRSGRARALVEACIAAATAANCTGITLEVAATNEPAIHLYTVCGLQQVAKRAAYYPVSVSNPKGDALVLARSIP